MEGVTPPEIITLLPLEKDRGRLRDVVGSNLAYVVNGNKSETEEFYRQTGRLHHRACCECRTANEVSQSVRLFR
jgi:hypothetical protein